MLKNHEYNTYRLFIDIQQRGMTKREVGIVGGGGLR